MIKQETRIALIEKEIATYQKYIDLIPVITTVIRTFDNKCINKKFENALSSVLHEDGERKFFISTGYNYDGSFFIRVHIYDNIIQQGKDPSSYYCITNDEYYYRFPQSDFEITSSDNYRIIADNLIITLDNNIKPQLFENITTLKTGLEKTDQMIKEAKALKVAFEEFETKYDYRLREVMGCMFVLRDNGGYEYKR